MTTKVIVRAKGGTDERCVPINKIQIPDLWHIANNQIDPKYREKILDCWHLCHDLLEALRKS